ncbi:MAG: RnfABCDGE type electron transport complex subunit D [Treponema sp.]|nr:RnfABCDGE type electron transport complex subunit D [Treponema sp.]
MPDKKIKLFTLKPQINLSYPSIGRMWLVCGCAFFAVLQSALGDNGRSLILALTVLFTAVLIEFLLTCRKFGFSRIVDGSAAATAMILCLMLPNSIHPVYAAFGVAFSIAVVKYSFGGLGSNWLNPALGGWLFMRFSWPSAFAQEPGASSITAITADSAPMADSISLFLNNTVFSVTGAQLPSEYINFLFSNNLSLITDRGIFALLAGTVIITAFGVNRGWVPLVFLAVYGFLVRFAGDLNGASGLYWNGDILYGLFSGGTLAAAFILAAEPASAAKLKPGILFTVILGAVLSWFFRYRCMDYSGCFYALAFVNCLTPLIRFAEEKILLSLNKRGGVNESIP